MNVANVMRKSEAEEDLCAQNQPTKHIEEEVDIMVR